jgi:hypothetical protein
MRLSHGCDAPRAQRGASRKQTIKFYYFWIVPIHPHLPQLNILPISRGRQGGAFSAPAGKAWTVGVADDS